MSRLFFGLELPVEWKQAMQDEMRRLRQKSVEANAWSNPDLLHVTILFIGVVDTDDVSSLHVAGELAASACEPIRLVSGRYGQFSRNKVFWLGFDKNESDWEKLDRLNRTIRHQVLELLPLDLDEKRFKPHITIARKLKGRVDVERLNAPAQLSTMAPHLCLFESTRIDGQLVYPVRARYPFSNFS